jgi:hypothetical protein
VRFRLGKTPARNAVVLRFGAYFKSAALPAPPLRFGLPELNPAVIPRWGMLANDQVGDCVIASAAHGEMVTRGLAGLPAVVFDDATSIADYSAIGGYIAGDAATDNGLDLQTAAAYRQRAGIVDAAGNRHKIDIYAAVRAGDLDELALAVFLFGSADIGVQLPNSADDQFEQQAPFRVLTNDGGIAGGHCICIVGRNSAGNYLGVTWGQLVAIEPAWLSKYMDEGIAYVPTERATTALLADFQEVIA